MTESGAAAKPASAPAVSDVRPTRPDEEAFKTASAAADKELARISEQLKAAREKLSQAQGKGPSGDKMKQFRAELDEVRASQARIKSSKSKVLEESRALEESINRRVADLRDKQKRLPFKSTKEIDDRIAQLTKQVESGQLKLVDERRSLAEVSQLKRSKKGFSEIASVQAAIDADKEKLAGVRKQLDDPETKSLSQAYTDIKTKMDALRVEQDDAYKGIKQLRDARDALQKKRDEAWEKKKGLGDEYYSKLNAFRAYDREQRQKHQQKIKLEREQQAAAKRKAEAEKRLREASFPAFADEITTCENLIRYFNPSAVVGNPADAAQPALSGKLPQLQANNTRTVEGFSADAILKKSDKDAAEDGLFAGLGGKKKSGKKNKPASATSDKINLHIGLINDLNAVGVSPPGSQSQVPEVVEALKKRIEYYLANQDAETKKRVDAVKKELEQLEKKEQQQQQEGESSTAQEAAA